MKRKPKRDIEAEAAEALAQICDLINTLSRADRKLYQRLEVEFSKAIAQYNYGIDGEQVKTLTEPFDGWTLCATDLVQHIRDVWANNENVEPMTEEEIRKKYYKP
mgnify:FL=1